MALVAVASLGGVAHRARADSLVLRLQPGFDWADVTVRDPSGSVSSHSRQYSGTYQLSFDKSLYETLGFAGTGTFQDARGRVTNNGVSLETQSRLWSGDARLTVGTDTLGGGIGYQRQDSTASSQASTDPFVVVQPAVTRELWQVFGRIAPVELPSLEVRLTRDSLQTVGVDVLTQSALGTMRYSPTPALSLTGNLQYTDLHDYGNDFVSKQWQEDGSFIYREALSRRSEVFVQGNLSHRTTDLTTGAAGGVVKTQRFPVEGLSLVEGVADTPQQDVLKVSAAVIDGDLATPTDINIGFGPTLAGDQAFREVGVHFVELQQVNLLEVWVDKRLPLAVSSAYQWTVYRSDNNRDWTPVTLTGPVSFDPAENRFNVPILTTTSPYFKVVTRPLPVAASPDVAFRNVFVTELRVFFSQSAADLRGQTSATSASVNGSFGYRILDVPNLRYDLGVLSTSTDWKDVVLQVRNALSAAYQLSSTMALSGSVVRQDSQDPRGHEGQLLWGASLTAMPLPTLTSGATYSGNYSQTLVSDSLTNGAALFARAALYRGVDVSANTGYSLTTQAGRITKSLTASATTSIVPTPWMTWTGSVVTARSTAPGPSGEDLTSTSNQLNGTVNITPFPALFLSAGVGRTFGSSVVPTTLYNVSGTYSPFREGDLLLTVGHAESFEPARQTKSRLSSASVRWNIVPPAFVETGWSLVDADELQTSTHAQSVSLRLTVTL